MFLIDRFNHTIFRLLDKTFRSEVLSEMLKSPAICIMGTSIAAIMIFRIEVVSVEILQNVFAIENVSFTNCHRLIFKVD